MKKILLILMFLSSIIHASSFQNIYGKWFFSSIDERKGVIFGTDIENDRGAKLTLEFFKNKTVKVIENNTLYYFDINNNNLYLTKNKIDLLNILKVNKKNQVDILKKSGKYKGCIVLKYLKKGMHGYYRIKGYKLCKIKDN
jgi:hypothetical protein